MLAPQSSRALKNLGSSTTLHKGRQEPIHYESPDIQYQSDKNIHDHSTFPVHSSASSLILQLSIFLNVISRASKLLLLFILSCIPLAYAGNPGDDFSNNVFSDLAPLLTLFGEKVTKQFISQSMSWTDHIILSSAPIGIITIVVSAIRVAGPQWLKNTIGRAVENSRTAEAELLPSTSSDVCELWDGRSVTRVLGAPNLVELVYRTDTKGGFVPDRNGGVYDLKTAVSEGIYRLKGQKGPETPEVSKEAPSLLLNVCGTGAGKLESAMYAAIGVITQLAVLAWCVLAVLKWRYLKGGKEVESYALPLTVSGTLLVCFGVMICSIVLQASTTEKVYERTHGPTKDVDPESAPIKRPRSQSEPDSPTTTNPISTRTVYLQRGGQKVNDQRFEAYAINGRNDHSSPHSEIKTSRRNHAHFEYRVVFGTVITIIGFVAQFLGFRAMHWSCPIVQLAAMGIMTCVRAVTRRGLSHWLFAKPISAGWEMETLASDLTRNLDWVVDTGDLNLRKKASGAFGEPEPGPHPVEDVVMVLQKLYVIIGWERPSRKLAISTAHAMENIMNILYNNQKDIMISQPATDISEFAFHLPISYKSLNPHDAPDPSFISIKLRRDQNTTTGSWGPWIADLDRLETVLGLWLFSRHNLQTDWNIAQTAYSLGIKADFPPRPEVGNVLRQVQSEQTPGDSSIPSRTQRQRQIIDRVPRFEIAGQRAAGRGSQRLHMLGRFEQRRLDDYKTWLEIKKSQVSQESGVTRCGIRVWDEFYVQLQSEASGNKFVSQRHDCFGFEIGKFDTGPPRPVSEPVKAKDSSYRKGGGLQFYIPQSVRGMTDEEFLARDKTMDVLMTTTQASGDEVLGLDLVAKFMWSAVDCIEAIHGVTRRRIINLEFDDKVLINSVLEEMAQCVVKAGLGELQDAYVAIVPPLSAAGKLPTVPEVIKQERTERAIKEILMK